MTERRRLPDRRACEGFDFAVGSMRYHATFSRFDDGAPGEIFLSAAKADSTADIVARDSAVAISIALQYGAPVDVIRRALMRDARGGPAGPAAHVLDVIAAEFASTATETAP
jgi:ribonucleoside-diphosphate reductase alpha chain